MNHRAWPRVRRILEGAFDRAPEDRVRFLDDACGADHVLRAEVETLLQHDECENSDDDLAPPLPGAARRLTAAASDGIVGIRIGPYRVGGVIASGGMGTVYRASRADDQFEQLVAIKVFRASSSSPGHARFERERRILARLEHPGITRLLDGGTLPDGRPYIVMEHVKGRPITVHAAEAGLDVPARLALMIDVCRAVHHAHCNLVVHRDLKPDNVLVAENGAVRLLDFGISKLLADDPAEPLDGLTLTAAAPMTLRYASPEQVSGAAITTATDVYALGVMLHELVTGRMPYDIGSSLQQATNAICRAEPRAPSSRDDALDREVDAIILHALEKDPARRYASAEALALDLRAYLDGHPVAAVPPTRWYLLRKAAARHRRALAVTAVFLILAVGAAISFGVLSVRLAHETRAAHAARARAADARAGAERLTEFLAATLVSADPLREGRSDLSVLSLLDDAARRAADPALDETTRAAVHLTLGRAYLNLWLVRDAEPHLDRAVAHARRAGADGILADALAARGETCAFLFRPEDAEASWRACLERRRLAGDEAGTAEAEFGCAEALVSLGRRDEARAMLEAALATRYRVYDGLHETIAETLEALAEIAARDGDASRAIELHDTALQQRTAIFGRRDDGYAAGIESRADLLRSLGRDRESLDEARRALALREELHGPAHALTIEPRIRVGVLERLHGHPDVAVAHMRRAVAVAEASLPEWHRIGRYARSATGLVLAEQGDDEHAVRLMQAALGTTVRQWGENHTLSLHLRIHMEQVLRRLERTAQADEIAVHDAAVRQRHLGAGDGHCPMCGFDF